MVVQGATVDVVVAGAINTDLVATVERAPEAGETVTGDAFHVFGGGKGANQAVAASRSGVGVALVGAVGVDAFGRDRLAELRGDGVYVDGVVQIDGMASGVALITVERAGENRIAYVPGPTLRVTGDHVVRAIRQHRPSVYLQPNEVVADAAAAALREARSIGAVTILNAAPDPAKVRSLLPEVDYLIVNEIEAFALAGRRGEFGEVAETLAQKWQLSVVLTAGADGAYGASRGDVAHVAAPEVDVVDTTGAGDTFCGAFATALARGAEFEAAMRFAVFAGSLTSTKAGAQPSIPLRADVERLMG